MPTPTETPPSRAPLPPFVVEAIDGGFRLTCPTLGFAVEAERLQDGYDAIEELTEGATPAPLLAAPDQFRWGRWLKVRRAKAPTSVAETEPSLGNRGITGRAFESRSPAYRSGNGVRNVAAVVFLGMLLVAAVPAVRLLNDLAAIVQDLRAVTSTVANAGNAPGGATRAASSTLGRAADTIRLLTPERQDEMAEDIAVIAEKLAPLAAEVCPLLSELGLAGECRGARQPTD